MNTSYIMNKPIFNPLVALEMKPEVTSIPVVNIRFPVAKKIDVEGSQQIVEKPGIIGDMLGCYADTTKLVTIFPEIKFVGLEEGLRNMISHARSL